MKIPDFREKAKNKKEWRKITWISSYIINIVYILQIQQCYKNENSKVESYTFNTN